MSTLEFPLVHRELARLGRRRQTYTLRVGLIGLVVAVLAFIWLFIGNLVDINSPSEFGAIGRVLAGLAFTLQCVIVFIVGPFIAGGLIVVEKEERSLGLLILADRRGWDIILSKFLSAFIQLESLLLTTLPIIALAAFFGSVSIPVIVQRLLLLTIAAVFMCALSIFYSTIVRQASTASSATIVTVILWIVSSYVLTAYGLFKSSIMVFFIYGNIATTLFLLGQPGQIAYYWIPSVVFMIAISVAALVAANHLLARQVDTPAVAPKKKGKKVAGKRSHTKRHSGFAKLNPIAEVIASSAGKYNDSFRAMFGRTLNVLVYAFFVLIPVVGTAVLLIALTREVAQSTISMRRNGALEDIALTPASDRELARSLMMSHLERLVIFLGAIFMTALLSAFLFPWSFSFFWSFLPMLPAQLFCAMTLACAVGMGGRPRIHQSHVAAIAIGSLYLIINVAVPAVAFYALALAAWGPRWAGVFSFPSVSALEGQLIFFAFYTVPITITYYFLGRLFYRNIVSRIRGTLAQDLGAKGPTFFSNLLSGAN